jgi:surface polysaccharide O-acyltransferase-like enzyme
MFSKKDGAIYWGRALRNALVLALVVGVLLITVLRINAVRRAHEIPNVLPLSWDLAIGKRFVIVAAIFGFLSTQPKPGKRLILKLFLTVLCSIFTFVCLYTLPKELVPDQAGYLAGVIVLSILASICCAVSQFSKQDLGTQAWNKGIEVWHSIKK